MPLRDVVDQLHDHDRLAYTGTAKQADLPALDEGRDQINDLDAGLEDLGLGLEIGKLRRRPVDRPAFGVSRNSNAIIDRLTQHVEDATQRNVAHRRGDGRPGVPDLHPPDHTVGAAHGNCPHLILPDVLLHFGGDLDRHGAVRIEQLDGVVDLGEVFRLELDVEHRADDLHDLSDILPGGGCLADPLRCDCGCHGCLDSQYDFRSSFVASYPCNAAAPPTISAISWVICACRCRL